VQLADRWLLFYAGEDDAHFGAKDELESLITTDPSAALKVIEELVLRAPNDKIVGVIGAGPLECLLADAGPQIVDSVLHAAERNPRLKAALSNVWEFGIDATVWKKIVAAFNK